MVSSASLNISISGTRGLLSFFESLVCLAYISFWLSVPPLRAVCSAWMWAPVSFASQKLGPSPSQLVSLGTLCGPSKLVLFALVPHCLDVCGFDDGGATHVLPPRLSIASFVLNHKTESQVRTCHVKFATIREETRSARVQDAQFTAGRTPGAHGPGITTPRIRKARGGPQAETSSRRGAETVQDRENFPARRQRVTFFHSFML